MESPSWEIPRAARDRWALPDDPPTTPRRRADANLQRRHEHQPARAAAYLGVHQDDRRHGSAAADYGLQGRRTAHDGAPARPASL